MNIETLIYNVFKAEHTATYRMNAPTPGTGTYIVLDMISDITTMSKDIATMSAPGGRIRMQARVYSDDTDTARSLIEQCATIIRTTANYTDTDVTWIFAQDTAGIQGGYSTKDNRFYYIIDFITHYITFST